MQRVFGRGEKDELLLDLIAKPFAASITNPRCVNGQNIHLPPLNSQTSFLLLNV